MVDINEYTRETTCEYKGEVYSVRDNGAVMRHAREGKKARKLDNVWTFGTKDKARGYMMISSHRVHIIVAKAFIPGNEDGKMVVDHIDTNRCNNRVENLRWLTKLENVLLNEATLKRVTYLCGGDINKFIENPSCLQDLTGSDQDIMWMRTVTPEEARLAMEHISSWAKRPISSYKMMKERETTKDFEDWLKKHEIKETNPFFGNGKVEKQRTSTEETNSDKEAWEEVRRAFTAPRTEQTEYQNPMMKELEERERLAKEKKESLTKGTFQIGFYEKMQFPLCPKEATGGLDSYAKELQIGAVIAISEKGDEYTIASLGWTTEWDAIQVEATNNGKRAHFYIHIKYEEGMYVHCNGEYRDQYRFCDSPNVLQCGARTQCYFPLCPKEGNITLEEYAEILHKDVLIEKNQYCDGYVIDREITQSTDGHPILYVGVSMPNSFKNYGDMIVFIENGKVIHQIGRTYFDERAVLRKFCMLRGQEWDDEEEIMDDYC